MYNTPLSAAAEGVYLDNWADKSNKNIVNCALSIVNSK